MALALHDIAFEINRIPSCIVRFIKLEVGFFDRV